MKKFIAIIIAKELEKDGEYKHELELSVYAHNISDAENLAPIVFQKELGNSDLSFVRVKCVKSINE